MRDGRKGRKGNPPKFGSRSDGSGAGTQQNMRRTVTFVERYQKKQAPFWGVLFLRKKAEPVRVCHGLFLLPPQAVFAFVGDTRGAIINDVMFLRGVKGVCFKENPIG